MEMFCLYSKTYWCYDITSIGLSSKRLNKRVLEHRGDEPLEKYRRVLTEKVDVTSNNRGFRANNNSDASYEQFKKGLSYFHPKQKVESGGIHTQLPNLKEMHSVFIVKCRVFAQL